MNNDTIIFDVDGTLWNACIASAKGWNIGLAKLYIDKKVSSKQIESVAGNPYDKCIAILLPGLQEQYPNLLDTLNNCEIEIIKSDGGTFYDGVIDGIKILASSYKIFLVSNCQDWYMKLFLEFSGLEPLLRSIHSLQLTGVRFQRILHMSNFSYAETLVSISFYDEFLEVDLELRGGL